MAADDLRLRRGALLLALYAQYPTPYATPAVEQALALHYTLAPEEFRRDLIYLESKRLIEIRRERIGGRLYETATLTPAGVDVVEGSSTDPGIHLVRPVG